MAGALGVGGDLTTWSEDELTEAADLIAAYKRIRPAVQHGTTHRLTGDGTLRAVTHTYEDQLVVLAWCPSRPFGHDPAPLRLTGVDPQAGYRDTATGTVHSGAVLLESGLPLDLPPGDHASVMVHLIRTPTKG
jgi:alpha-galactosidase